MNGWENMVWLIQSQNFVILVKTPGWLALAQPTPQDIIPIRIHRPLRFTDIGPPLSPYAKTEQFKLKFVSWSRLHEMLN